MFHSSASEFGRQSWHDAHSAHVPSSAITPSILCSKVRAATAILSSSGVYSKWMSSDIVAFGSIVASNSASVWTRLDFLMYRRMSSLSRTTSLNTTRLHFLFFCCSKFNKRNVWAASIWVMLSPSHRWSWIFRCCALRNVSDDLKREMPVRCPKIVF